MEQEPNTYERINTYQEKEEIRISLDDKKYKMNNKDN